MQMRVNNVITKHGHRSSINSINNKIRNLIIQLFQLELLLGITGKLIHVLSIYMRMHVVDFSDSGTKHILSPSPTKVFSAEVSYEIMLKIPHTNLQFIL